MLVQIRATESTPATCEIGVDAYTTVDDNGSFVMRGLPPGTWKIAALARIGDDRYEGEVEAKPGDTVRLEVK